MNDYQTSLGTAVGMGSPLILIQYLIVVGEYYYAKRWRRPPLRRAKLNTLTVAQLLSPAFYFIIYP
jgi:hypothetical protein